MPIPVLSNGGKYTFIGTYIGQYISPRSVSISADRRLPTAFGKGSRLAQVFNLELRRAFIKEEVLTFTPVAPFRAVLKYAADGSQDLPVKLRKSNGQTVRPDQYSFVKDINGNFTVIQIRTEAFDQTATYVIDYQSVDRRVKDQLPVDNLREIRAVGDTTNQEKYKEFEDFYIPTDFSLIEGRPANTNKDSAIENPVPNISNVGTGSIVQSAASSFEHSYNRYYTITCVDAVGTAPSRSATFEWTSTPVSGGNFSLPPSPVHHTAPANTFTITEGSPISLNQQIELGVEVTLDFGSTNFSIGDVYTFNGLGPSLIEVDLRHLNDNETVRYGNIVPGQNNTGTGSCAHAGNTNFSGEYSVGAMVYCTAVSGVAPNREASFAWSLYRELGASGAFTIQENNPASLNQALTLGLKIVFGFGNANFAVGDIFSFLVDPPMEYVYFKDDRQYLLTATSATNPTATSGYIEGTYSVNTQEGGFGTFEATVDYSTPTAKTGRFMLPDNLVLIARNMVRGGAQANQFSSNDKFDLTTSLSDYIDFSLTKPATDERDPEDVSKILLDVTGKITGTPNTYYTILSFIPLQDLKVLDSVTGGAAAYSQIPNSAYIYFPAKPANKLVITYRHRGNEPDPGNIYYFTANYLRPDEFYNTLRIVSSLEEGRQLLGPATTDNDLYIANEIAWNQPGNIFQVGFVQVKDADDDGEYTITDYRNALVASESSSLISDRCLLGFFEALPELLVSNVRLSDPYKAREHLCWIGAPIGTPVGNIDTENSLVYLARRTLQVYGESPAHGTRILVAPTWAKGTITLQDGTSAQVTLDGSFYAWAQAAKVCGFQQTSDSILLTTDGWFDEVEVHDESDRMRLGESSIVFPVSAGSGVYQVYEDVTVDTFAPDFHEINAMVQKQDVTRAVRAAMTSTLIGLKIRSGEESIATITGVLSRILINLQTQGRVASWQDEQGNIRPFDPSKDIRVYRNVDNPTEFAFHYNYFLTYILKRLNGLYSVDTAKLELPASGNLG